MCYFTDNHCRFVHNFHFPTIKSLQTTNYTFLTYKPSTELQDKLHFTNIARALYDNFFQLQKNCILIVFNTAGSEETNFITGFSVQSQSHCYTCNVLFTIPKSFVLFIVRVDYGENLLRKKQCIVHWNGYHKFFHHMFPVSFQNRF